MSTGPRGPSQDTRFASLAQRRAGVGQASHDGQAAHHRKYIHTPRRFICVYNTRMSKSYLLTGQVC